MKSGASDPFADDSNDDEPTEDSPSTETNTAEQSDETAPSKSTTSQSEQSDEPVTLESNTGQSEQSEYPLKLRRDKVKDERENVHQLFVQDDTDRKARDAERTLEDKIGEDVYRLDAREAIYLAGIANLDDAAATLRDWGYDL